MIKLFYTIPTGVGSKGSIKLDANDERDILVEGARWAIKRGTVRKRIWSIQSRRRN